MEYDKRIEIRYLLDAYFEGETTGEQEHRLKEYLLSEDVPSDLLYARAMFAGFSRAAEDGCACQPEFGPKEESIGTVPTAEVHDAITETAPAAVGQNTTVRKNIRRRMIYVSMSVAASLMIILGVTFTQIAKSRPTVYCYMNGEPVTDINIAARQAQMAARLLEGSARASADGMAKVTEASKPMEKIESTLRMLGMEK